MAQPTGFITSTGNYINNDLNTIFAPINKMDYGTILASTFGALTTYQRGPPLTITTPNIILSLAISTSQYNGFQLKYAGVYRLTLRFNIASSTSTPINICFGSVSLAGDSQPISNDNISPILDNIYNINVQAFYTDATSNANNKLILNTNSPRTYYCNFTISAASQINLLMIDMTFFGAENQFIYPALITGSCTNSLSSWSCELLS